MISDVKVFNFVPRTLRGVRPLSGLDADFSVEHKSYAELVCQLTEKHGLTIKDIWYRDGGSTVHIDNEETYRTISRGARLCVLDRIVAAHPDVYMEAISAKLDQILELLESFHMRLSTVEEAQQGG
jgi:hypothetical protein